MLPHLTGRSIYLTRDRMRFICRPLYYSNYTSGTNVQGHSAEFGVQQDVPAVCRHTHMIMTTASYPNVQHVLLRVVYSTITSSTLHSLRRPYHSCSR
jgi:hypothetical protein